ncbi:alpha/beta-hydrolase [Suillus hirtellus]|nr:alpha/beta-hydrolase [Suillus hirtellus]
MWAPVLDRRISLPEFFYSISTLSLTTLDLPTSAHCHVSENDYPKAGFIDTRSKANPPVIRYVKYAKQLQMLHRFQGTLTLGRTCPCRSGSLSLETHSKQPHLLYENGPCLVNADHNSTTLNPYSWNNLSNMIYIDQPIGTGFSYCNTDTKNSTETAASYVWTVSQVYLRASYFRSMPVEKSYGGHYGPSFVTYFEEQNRFIASGGIDAIPVVVKTLMINNGWFDPLIQNIAWLNSATHAPGYGQLQPDEVLKDMSNALHGSNGCVAQEKACYAAGNSTSSNRICQDADDYCIDNLYYPAVHGELRPA